MPAVLIRTRVKGRSKEIDVPMYANSLADFVILTDDVVKAIDPEPLGIEEELEVAGGKRVKGPLYLVRIEVQNLETKKKKEVEVEAVMLKKERVCVLGIKALEKLGIILDMERGKYTLK